MNNKPSGNPADHQKRSFRLHAEGLHALLWFCSFFFSATALTRRAWRLRIPPLFRYLIFNKMSTAFAAFLLLCIAPTTYSAEVDATDASGFAANTIPINIVTLNNTSNPVRISGLPADAVLSAGTQSVSDPTVWTVPAANTTGLTVTSSSTGIYSLSYSQGTDTNQFTSFDNGTFGSGSNITGTPLGSTVTSFIFDDGTTSGSGNSATRIWITPGEYSITHSTEVFERAPTPVYHDFYDRTDPGNGYIAFYDAKNPSSELNQTFITENLSLLPDTEYNFSFYAANVYNGAFGPDNVFPNFSVRLDGVEIATTGSLPGGMTDWARFESTFTTDPGVTSAVLTVVMIADPSGNSTGNVGADIVFDDFYFSRSSNDTAELTISALIVPPNPIEVCTWNWNQWVIPGGYIANDPTNYNPTKYLFEKFGTSAGANTWYATSASPDATFNLADQQSPTDSTSSTDSERTYGVGYFQMVPNTTRVLTLTDPRRADGHALAVFDSSGDLIARYPSLTDVSNGQYYIASAGAPVSDSEAINKGSAWSDTLSFTVPADGDVYIHYLNADENNFTQYMTEDLDACDYDFSDAPNTYGEANHKVVKDLQLGGAITPETAGYDDANAAGDADDGVILPAMTQGTSATISVAVSQSAPSEGYLQGWIDWNSDGDFADAGEHIATDLQSATAGSSTISVSVSVPATAITTQTIARFRWSTTAGLDSTTAANDGEVEDYALTVEEAVSVANVCTVGNQIFADDFGTGGPKMSANISNHTYTAGQPVDGYYTVNNPRNFTHWFLGSGNLYDHTPGDTDGSVLAINMVNSPAEFYRNTVTGLTPNLDVSFEAWINGTCQNCPDRGQVEFQIQDTGGNILFRSGSPGDPVPNDQMWYKRNFTFNVGSNTSFDLVMVNDAPSGSNGNDLLIDDIAICQVAVDHGDAPVTSTNYGTPQHVIVSDVYLGGSVTSDSAAYNHASAAADADDGVTLPAFTQGNSASIPVVVNQIAANDGYLQGWIDWNGDGDFTDAGEQIATNMQSNTSGSSTINIPVSVPATAITTQTFARFRWSTNGGLSSVASSIDGEVEDYALTVAAGPTNPVLPKLIPSSCGMMEAEGYTLDGMGIGSERFYQLESGSTTHDPDVFFGVTGTEHAYTKNADGSIDYYFDGEAPVATISSMMGPINQSLTAIGGAAPDQTNAAEFWRITGRAQGVAGQTYSLSATNGNAHELFYYWVEDSAGTVIATSLGQANTADGWMYGTSSSNATSGPNSITASPTTTINYTVPASNTDGIIYINMLMLDPQAHWGPINFPTPGCPDFGDAPTDLSSIDASLSAAYGDASHIIDSVTYLGSTVDPDVASQSAGLNADGDDSDGSNDDDGVTFPLAGTTPVLRVDQANTVTVTASVNGFLNAWIDWNQDGDWNDAGETIASNTPMIAGTNALTLTPAVTAPQGATYMRFRFTSASVTTPSPIGQLPDGEVEDYRVNLMIATPIDVCSSVILNTGFEASPNPSTFIQPLEDQVMGWATIPEDPNSGANYNWRNQIEIWASGFQGTPAFEGGYFAEINASVAGMLYQDVELTPGSSYTWSFAHRARGAGINTLSVMMGYPGATVSQGTFSTDATAWKVYSGIYTVPAGQYITRFGFQAEAGSGGYGNFIDAVQIPGGCDFGDAPDSYGTLKSNNGAHHVSNSLLFLGPNPGDSETDGQPSASATNDDTISASDEDGVVVLNSLTAIERSYSVDVTVTNQTGTTAALVAWIDFDGNGTFDPDEAAIRSVPTGVTGGSITLNWSAIPFDIQAGDTYLRLRLTTEAMNNQEPDGVKSDGEVEDYALTIGGTTLSGRVYIDANSNASDDSEAGIGSTVVVLHDIFTGTCRSVSTSGGGSYSFAGVLDGGYEIYQAHGDTTPIPQNCGTAFANNPTGYQSTTDDILYATVAGADISGQDFGEVAGSNSPTSGNTGAGIAFDPNHQSEVLPGNVAFYAHVFTTEAEGSVSFTSTGSGNTTAGWSHTLYQDSDCNGVLDGTEGSSPIGTNLVMTADSRLCLINKVFAPANVPAQDQYQVITAATFSFAGSTVGPTVLEVTDLTIAGQNDPSSGSTPQVGASRLVLRKTVENLTQLGAETDTLNQADPGDFLKYRLYYRNTGSGPITTLQVDDVVPSYTGLVNGSNVCDVTPPGMTCTPNLNIDELSWDFTGSLVGGAEGNVSYEVMVDN